MVESNQPVPAVADPGPPMPEPAPGATVAPAPAPADPNRLRKRSLGIIAAIVIAISLAASAAVLINIKSGTSYPAGSPEATVMSWAAALKAGDSDTADAYLSSRLLKSGSGSDMMVVMSPSTADFSIQSSSTAGSTATVVLSVSHTNSGVSSVQYSIPVRLSMVLELGSWKIDRIGF